MTPTTRFRFVIRYEPTPIRILQQWWEVGNMVLAIHVTDKDGNTLPSPNCGEWRDIPLENEA
jgi:hypothetical protein